jgi:hypothetical protein
MKIHEAQQILKDNGYLMEARLATFDGVVSDCVEQIIGLAEEAIKIGG